MTVFTARLFNKQLLAIEYYSAPEHKKKNR